MPDHYFKDFYTNLKSVFYRVLCYLFAFRGLPVSISGAKLYLPPLHYRIYPSSYEAYNLRTLLRLQLPLNTTAIDIGAHFGLYSVLLAKYLNLRVISIEPTPYSFSVLLQTICMNSLQSFITPINAAVSNEEGISSFNIQQTVGSVANSLINYQHSKEPKKSICINTLKIDSLAFQSSVSFIKIDAEGSEMDVLSGAQLTIAKYKPIILLGLHPAPLSVMGYSLSDVNDFIDKIGYEIISYSSPEISRSNFLHQTSVFDIFIAPQISGSC